MVTSGPRRHLVAVTRTTGSPPLECPHHMRSFTASLRPLARVLDRLAEGVAAVALLVAAVPV